MDFRLPGMDGVETTIELSRECPSVAVVCLTASASPRELDALKAAGAVDCLRKDQELDEIVAAIRSAGRGASREPDASRTRRSCSTRPPTSRTRRSASRTCGSCRSTSASARRASATTSSSTRTASTSACAPRPSCRPPRSRRRRTSSPSTTRSPATSAIYSLHISAKLSGTFQSASLAAAEDAGDRIRLVDTESASVGIALLALAIQELLARGTTDEEIEALAERYRREVGLLFTVDTLEFLAKGGRIGRAKALAGSLLNVKPILTIVDGEVVPLTRVRGRQKALEEFRKRFEEATSDGPGLAMGFAHAEAEETVEQLREIVLAARPQAEVKLVTTLGAVVGTHAGPGTVGFFWFQH